MYQLPNGCIHAGYILYSLKKKKNSYTIIFNRNVNKIKKYNQAKCLVTLKKSRSLPPNYFQNILNIFLS